MKTDTQMRQLLSGIEAFHNDEEGLETLQVVMILAVAAVALIVVKNKWTTIKNWFNTETEGATSGW